MKNVQILLLSMALLILCSTSIPAQTNGSGGIIRGDIRYEYNCDPGFIGIQTKGCQLHVQFFEWFDQAGFNLQTAQQICRQNGWVLATPQEVKAAWENIRLDHFAFGMMADGNFALPIQQDYRHFKKGPNIGVNGGNQGFFYVQAAAVPRGQQTVSTTQSQPTGGGIIVSGSGATSYYPNGSNAVPDHAPDPVVSVTMAHCYPAAGAPNDPTDNWMMEMWPDPVTVASNSLLVQAGKSYLNKKGFPVNDQSLQILAAAVKNDPVARFKFAPFLLQECFAALMAPNPNAVQLAYKRAFQDHQSCEDYNRAVRTLEEWEAHQGRGAFSGPPAYSPTLLSSVNYQSRPSVDAFLKADPLQFQREGGEAVALLFLPMASKAGVLEGDEHLSPIADYGDDLTAITVAAGIGSAAAVSATIVGGSAAYLSYAGAKILAALPAHLATASAAKTSMAVSFANLAGPAIVATVAAAILGVTVADAARTTAYEAKVRADANRAHNFTVEAFLDVPASEKADRKKALFILMIKHLIARPANLGRFTLALPPVPMPTEYTAAEVDALSSEKLKEVKFHAQNFISMTEAQRIAKQNGWTIATAEQVQNAWTYNKLDVYAFGMMADGRFAVPVQRDHSNFKKGSNIGAVGGNQGFFYTTVNNSPATTAPVDKPSTADITSNQPEGDIIDLNSTYIITDAKHNQSLVTGMVYSGGVFHQTPRNSPVDASWYFLPTGDGYYYIYDLRFNKALAGPDYYNHLGGGTHFVYHQDPNGRTNAQWKITPSDVPGKYIITDRKHGKSLVAGDVADNNIYLQSHNNRLNAYWTFTATKDKAPAVKPDPKPTPTTTTTSVTTKPATNTIAPASAGLVRILSFMGFNNYFHYQNNKLETGQIQANWSSSQWKLVPVAGGLVRIQNSVHPDKYLHIQNGPLELGTIDLNWASALWKIVPAQAGVIRIQSSLHPDKYIYPQGNDVVVGIVDFSSYSGPSVSSMWKIEGEIPSTEPNTPTTTAPATGTLLTDTTTSTAPVSSTMAPASPGYVRIQNYWKKSHYIHNENGKLEDGFIQPNWWSSQWKIVPVHSGWVRIQNKWKPDQYLHNQNGKLEVGTIDPNWASAMWKLVPAPHAGWVRIQNSWYQNHYIHNQNGRIEVGEIDNSWGSALWKVE